MLYVHSYTIVQTRTIHVTHMWPPAHTQHTTTNNNDNDEFDDHNNKEQQEQYHKYHNHHNHHQQPRYHHRQLDNGPNDVSRIVWAIQWVFFFLRVFFLLLNNIYSNCDYIIAMEGLREGGDEENGPKHRESRRLGH